MSSRALEQSALLALTALALLLSAIHPHDRATWWLEVGPVLIGVAILIPTRRRFPLTQLLYRLLFIHALILILGGHYTYARVPLGTWMQELFDFSRNHYDRIGHFAQGFIPAILAREVLLRTSPLQTGKWLFTITVAICLSFSALYELFEWWTAVAVGSAADDFLGTQGDPWDTQWDMFLALTGAVVALVVLAKAHDKELDKLAS